MTQHPEMEALHKRQILRRVETIYALAKINSEPSNPRNSVEALKRVRDCAEGILHDFGETK